MNIVNAGPKVSPNTYGMTTDFIGIYLTPKVYANNIANAFSDALADFTSIVGTVGAHELTHRITHIKDLPYNPNVPNDLMSVDDNPHGFTLLGNNELRLTLDEGLLLQQDCVKKHR